MTTMLLCLPHLESSCVSKEGMLFRNKWTWSRASAGIDWVDKRQIPQAAWALPSDGRNNLGREPWIIRCTASDQYDSIIDPRVTLRDCLKSQKTQTPLDALVGKRTTSQRVHPRTSYGLKCCHTRSLKVSQKFDSTLGPSPKSSVLGSDLV